MIFFDRNFETELLMLAEHKLPYFRKISLRIVNSAADADDAVQSAFIKAWKNRASFRQEAGVSGWLAKIVINESYEIVRKRLREEKKISGVEVLEEQQNRYDLELLDRVVMDLPELYRDTVLIAVLGELTTAEAAAELGCSENTLYQRIHKAKDLIRQGFAKYENQ